MIMGEDRTNTGGLMEINDSGNHAQITPEDKQKIKDGYAEAAENKKQKELRKKLIVIAIVIIAFIVVITSSGTLVVG